MRASDVVSKLRLLLPQLTGELTDDVEVSSVTRSGTQLTVRCLYDHHLEVGRAVALSGAVTQIAISSLTRVGTVGTLGVAADHDLTSGIASTVTLSGSVEAEFNGTFDVLKIANRRTIEFEMADAGATSATGSPVLQGAESALRDYNVLYEVLQVPNEHSFVVQHPATDLLDPIGSIVARTRPRISAGVNPDRLMESYTVDSYRKKWLFVVLGDATAVVNEAIQTPISDFTTRGADYQQHVTQSFSLYLFIPCDDETAAAAARDEAEDLFGPICRSVLNSRFDSGLSVGEVGTVHFLRHGPHAYNSAVYVHEFEFEQVVTLTEGDTVGPDLDVAFRDILMTQDPDLGGTTTLSAEIDLDEEPL